MWRRGSEFPLLPLSRYHLFVVTHNYCHNIAYSKGLNIQIPVPHTYVGMTLPSIYASHCRRDKYYTAAEIISHCRRNIHRTAAEIKSHCTEINVTLPSIHTSHCFRYNMSHRHRDKRGTAVEISVALPPIYMSHYLRDKHATDTEMYISHCCRYMQHVPPRG